MWKLTNQNLNTNYLSKNNFKTNNFSKLKPNTNLTSYGIISSILKKYNYTNYSFVDNNNGTYTISISEDPFLINTPEDTFIEAKDYNNPRNGEYLYNNGKITIYSDKKITNINVITKPSGIKSLRLFNIPSFLYNLPIQGGFSISENFQDLPSASFVFITTRKNLNTYRSRLKTGSVINLFKYTFIINSYSEEIKQDTNEVVINISLRGIQEKYLNKPILLNENIQENYNSFLDPECQVNYNSSDNNLVKYLNINTLASRVGTSVRGLSFKVKVPSDKSDSSTTTLNTELNKYLEIKQSFLDLNGKDIIVKKINNIKQWTFTQNDLTSSFSTTINSNPVNPIFNYGIFPEEQNINLNGLVPDIVNTTVLPTAFSENYNNIPYPTLMNATTPNLFNNAGVVLKPETTIQQEPKYKTKEIKRKYYTKGDPNPTIPPDNVTRLNSLDFNFDRSGATKTEIFVAEENGSTVYEIIKKYGFAYKASDIYVFKNNPTEIDPNLDGDPNDWWKLIEQIHTNYYYDEETGYLLGYDSSGARYLRHQVEDDELPTIELSRATELGEESLSQEEILTFNSYKFGWVPYYAAKRYFLVQHRDFYRNFQSDQKQIKKCLRDGTSIYVDNPLYVESMFALYESEEKQCFSYMSNPNNVGRESEDIILPLLITGEESYNRNYLEILPSQNTNPGFYRDPSLPEQDTYLTYTSNFSAQEPGFSTIVENTQVTENNGIPNTHTKKDSKYELIEPKEEEKKENATYRYIMWTDPYKGTYPRESEIFYEEAKNIQDVLDGVKFKLKIDDMRNSLTSSTSIPINLNISTGDVCTFNIDGINYKRRIISLNHNFIIDGIDKNGIPILLDGNTSLTLGIDRDININYKQEKIPANKPYSPRNNNINITTKGFTLGSILPKRYRTRGNYYADPN